MTTNRDSNGLPTLIPCYQYFHIVYIFAVFMTSPLYTEIAFLKTCIYTYKYRHTQMTKKAIKWKEKNSIGMRKSCCKG